MRSSSVESVRVRRISTLGNGENAATGTEDQDWLAVEEPLEIRIGMGPANQRTEKSISVTMCTPGHAPELATGFLFTEGIITGKHDISAARQFDETGAAGEKNNIVLVELRPGLDFDPKKLERHFYTSSSCGVCGKSSIDAVKNIMTNIPGTDQLKISAGLIAELPLTLRRQQEIFEQTGGLHASALFDMEGNLLLLREDVGRHNALDKLVGAALEGGMLPLDHHILLLSGRASFELIQKAIMAGIKIVCAVGAPSSLAVEMAVEYGITLVGFLRDNRFNIYAGGQRLAADKDNPFITNK